MFTPHGFKDKSQGNLFFYLATIASVKRPLALILENVKNLVSHDKGKTWNTIKSTLEDMNYKVFYKVIDAILQLEELAITFPSNPDEIEELA